MLAAGASVFITGRRMEKLRRGTFAARRGRSWPRSWRFHARGGRRAVTEAAVEFLGGLDTLVVSSGTSAIGSILTASRAQFEDVLTTNLVGPFLAVRSAAPHLIRAAPASVILIASVVGTSPP